MPREIRTIRKTDPDSGVSLRRGRGIHTMPISMAIAGPKRKGRPDGLEPGALQSADRVARRLHESIRTFLNACPGEAQNASGLSRVLGIDRTTCQRAVFATGSAYEGPGMIERLPGLKGLRAMVDAARGVGAIDSDAVDRLGAAVDRFASLIEREGGSVAELLRRIEATPLASDSVATGRGADAREALFRSAAEVTGRCSETWVAVYAYHPVAGDTKSLHIDRVNGLVGHVARPDAVPLTFHNFTSSTRDKEDGSPAHGQFTPLVADADPGSPATVLRDFSSSPLPVVSTRQPNEFMVQAIDADPETIGQPVDLMFGTRGTMVHPRTQKPPLEEAWALVNFPTRAMIFDIYLHRDVARGCIPSLDAHLWRPDFAQQVGDRWQTRFADGPRLQLLGSGLSNAASPYYARHPDLTRFLFEQIGADASHFVGYRCEVEFPMWRTGYCVGLDFGEPDND